MRLIRGGRRLGLTAAVVVLLLVLVMLARAWRFAQPEDAAAPPPTDITIDETGAVLRLSEAIAIRTISRDGEPVAAAAFEAFHAFLAAKFPGAHAAMTRETISKWSLLYHWAGTDPEATPVLFMAHQDVVPVADETRAQWEHPPFSGAIADGFIWGRGTMDVKSGILGLLEAVESLAAQGFKPQRDIYLAFGHDEEVGGNNGAREIAATLDERGITFAMAMDEGGAVATGVVPGVEKPVALVGVAEKGYQTLRIVAEGPCGHSSVPDQETTVGRLAKAVVSLTRRPMPARLTAPVEAMLEALAPYQDFLSRVAIANRGLFDALILDEMRETPRTNALVRTTTAPTMLHAGVKENVLPCQAEATVNFRLLPGDTPAMVRERVEKLVAGPGISVEAGMAWSASPVTRTNSHAYRTLGKTIGQMFPDAVVVPNMVTGYTDARYYADVSENVLRFLPIRLDAADLSRAHGLNERIAIAAYMDMIRFYTQLMRNMAGARTAPDSSTDAH